MISFLQGDTANVLAAMIGVRSCRHRGRTKLYFYNRHSRLAALTYTQITTSNNSHFRFGINLRQTLTYG